MKQLFYISDNSKIFLLSILYSIIFITLFYGFMEKKIQLQCNEHILEAYHDCVKIANVYHCEKTPLDEFYPRYNHSMEIIFNEEGINDKTIR